MTDILAQTVIQNPYWEIVKTIPGHPYSPDGTWRPDQFPMPTGRVTPEWIAQMNKVSRNTLCAQYSWSIPSPDAVDWMVQRLNGRPVVEIGAGTGYWAYLLKQHGVDVVAYDISPPRLGKNHWHCRDVEGHKTGEPIREWVEIIQGGPVDVTRHADRVLFLCWPPYDRSFGTEVVANYTNAGGDTIFFAGESEGGCTGDDELYHLLWDAYETGASGYCPDHVTWYGIHDNLIHFTRKVREINA